MKQMDEWTQTDARMRHLTSFNLLAVLNDSTCCEYDGLEVLMNRMVCF